MLGCKLDPTCKPDLPDPIQPSLEFVWVGSDVDREGSTRLIKHSHMVGSQPTPPLSTQLVFHLVVANS